MSVINLIERAGNLLLSLDPETAEQLNDFKDKEFCIEILDPKYTLYLTPCAEGFNLNTEPSKKADVTLSGSLWSFIKLAREGAKSDVFYTGRIQMRGDAELGQAFQKVMMQMDIDWEEITSKMFGDFASRQINNAIAEVRGWFSGRKQQFDQNAGEVLQEEWQTVPSNVEAEQFAGEIENLRSDVERLEARIAKLRKQLDAKAS